MVAESKVGAEVKAWPLGPCVSAHLSGSKKVSVYLVWTTPGIVPGWVCPGRRGGSLESVG